VQWRILFYRRRRDFVRHMPSLRGRHILPAALPILAHHMSRRHCMPGRWSFITVCGGNLRSQGCVRLLPVQRAQRVRCWERQQLAVSCWNSVVGVRVFAVPGKHVQLQRRNFLLLLPFRALYLRLPNCGLRALHCRRRTYRRIGVPFLRRFSRGSGGFLPHFFTWYDWQHARPLEPGGRRCDALERFVPQCGSPSSCRLGILRSFIVDMG